VRRTGAVILALGLALAGCSPAARFQRAVQTRSACLETVAYKPEFAPLLPHVFMTTPSMAQLTDETYATNEEARLLALQHDDVMQCLNTYIAAIGPIFPQAVPIYIEARDEVTARTALLIERKITWAESARRSMAINERLHQALAKADAERREEARQNAAIATPILMQMMQNSRPAPYVPPSVPTFQPPLRLQTTCTTIGQITSYN